MVFFAARCFPNSFFYKTALFAASEALFTKFQKFLDFGGFAPRPARRTRAVTGVARTPSATLCAFQVTKYFFQVLVPGELEAQLRFILKCISSDFTLMFKKSVPAFVM